MRLQYTFQLRHDASVEIPVVLELSSVSLHHGAIAQRLHVVSTAAYIIFGIAHIIFGIAH